MVLFRTDEPNSSLRTMSLRLYPLGRAGLDHSRFGLSLIEEFSGPEPYSYELTVAYESLGSLLGLLEGRFDLPHAEHLDDSAALIVPELVRLGELGPHLPPGANRERLAVWCDEAGVRPFWGGRTRTHRILSAGAVSLDVSFWTVVRSAPVVRFTESHGRGTTHDVTAPLETVPALATRFEQRLGLDAAAGRPEDRLLACFDAMVVQGHLGASLPRQVNRALVAEWITEAGITPTLRGFARVERLVRVHREATSCIYELVLTMDPAARAGDGITFAERYEYLPRPGDAGREYAYSVKASYSALAALAGPGEDDPEERVIGRIRDLVDSGDLGLREARERVAAWFADCGVPPERTESSWINSD